MGVFSSKEEMENRKYHYCLSTGKSMSNFGFLTIEELNEICSEHFSNYNSRI